MMRKKSQKVFKHVFSNPFTQAWPDISNEELQQVVNILNKESIAQAISGIKVNSKIQKISEANLDTFVNQNLIIGINSIIKHIEKVNCVVLLKCEANEVLVEPLMLLCRAKGIKCISGNFEVTYEKLREITGVKKLAAFAFPIMSVFPQTEAFISTLAPISRRLLPAVIKSIEIIKNK